jgi:hypothetical protein
MKKLRLVFSFILVISASLLISCEQGLKNAAGNDDDIIVFADSADFYELEASLLTVFNKVIYTPQPEVLFHLVRKDISQFDIYKKYKNILFLSPVNAKHSVGNFVDNLLSDDVKKLVSEDSISVVNKYDVWAKNQIVMVVAASSLQKLNESILNEHQNLTYFFHKASAKRLYSSLYNEKYEQKKVEAQLLKDYGWLIYVQADFTVALNKAEDNFVWLRRGAGSDMERGIFVHWIENASPNLFAKDSVLAIRNKLTEKFYRTSNDSSYVVIEDEYKNMEEVNFLNRYAIMTQGIWAMADKSMGGPFVNYTFYDEKSKRLYMLDGSVYAPKYYKKKIIQQVDVMLQSFLTDNDLTQERKEDLLDELD